MWCCAGSVSAVLLAAAGLPQLRALDLANQLLTGQLPAAVTFPSLETLRVTNNQLTVRTPSWHPCLALSSES